MIRQAHSSARERKLPLAKSQGYLESCAKIGERIPPVDNLGDEIQKYVCDLYGQKDVVEVNVARHNLFKLGKFAEENLPPNDDRLQQHLLRSNYQAFIWKNSLSNVLNLPSPSESGWMFEGDKLVVRWIIRPCAPEGIT